MYTSHTMKDMETWREHTHTHNTNKITNNTTHHHTPQHTTHNIFFPPTLPEEPNTPHRHPATRTCFVSSFSRTGDRQHRTDATMEVAGRRPEDTGHRGFHCQGWPAFTRMRKSRHETARRFGSSFSTTRSRYTGGKWVEGVEGSGGECVWEGRGAEREREIRWW